jgi:hypothetical protein
MAIKKRRILGIVDFIHPSDDAINTDINPATGKPVSDIEKYKEGWKFAEHCALKEGKTPTIFKINFEVDHKALVAMKNASIGGFGKDQDMGFKLGSHAAQVVKTVLVGIVCPPDQPEDEQIKFFKDLKTGYVTDACMAELEQLDIVDTIYSFYMAHKQDDEMLKKS